MLRRSARFSSERCGSNFTSFKLNDSSWTSSWNFWWKKSITFSKIAESAPRAMKPISFIACTMRGVSRVSRPGSARRCRAHLRRDLGDGAEVEEHDRHFAGGRVLAHEDVPGMRIGVIDAVGEDLLAVGVDDRARELAAIDPERVEPRVSVTLTPSIHSVRQDARRRQLAHAPWESRRRCASVNAAAMRSTLSASPRKSSSCSTIARISR